MNKFLELASIDTAVHFRILKPGINRFNVGLYDKESDLPIYVKKNWDLQEGIIYFVGPSATLSKPRTIYLKIESREGGVQIENINYGTGPSRYPVVLGKKYKFSHNDRDAAFFTLLEVFYERLYDKYFVKVEKDDVVLDIGANLGMFSVYCQNFHPARVVSVEPGEEEFPCLLENIKPFKNSEALKYAVSRETGKVRFSATSEGVSNHVEGLLDSSELTSRVYGTAEVDSININDLISEANLDRIDYMKVDCEGSELDIFQTIDKEYLKSKVKKIAVEYHSLSIKHNLLDLLSEYFLLENLESAEETKEIGMLYFYNKNFYSF